MHIEALAPTDDAMVAQVVDLRMAAHRADFPDGPPSCPEWERGVIRFPGSSGRYEWWLARDAGALLGVAHICLREADNVGTALVDVTVHPAARRRGIGTVLTDVARDRVGATGRELIVAESTVGGGAEAFARRIGADAGLLEHRQRLLVNSAHPARWQALLKEASEHARGYHVVRWRDAVPDEHLDDLSYLQARMSTDIPLDDLRWQPEEWDAERIRAEERITSARGGRRYTTGVVHKGSGHLVGFTTLAYLASDQASAWQWDTIVDPAHRGHRLGTVLKVANLHFALEHEPGTRCAITWNALSNTQMNAINAALGFEPLDHWCEWQLQVRPSAARSPRDHVQTTTSIGARPNAGRRTPMRDTRATWSNRTFEALFGAAYNFGVEHQGLSRPAGRALFGTDADLVYASMDEVREMPDGSAILDVPCGGGVTLSRLRSAQRVRYVAADISVTMLDRARRRASEHGVRGVEFVEADIERMPFDEAEFDLCACFNGLHCVPDPAAAVREMARCLKPGGRLIGDYITNGVRRRTDAFVAVMRAGGVFGPSGTADELERWLTSAGLCVHRLEPSGAITHFAATKLAY